MRCLQWVGLWWAQQHSPHAFPHSYDTCFPSSHSLLLFFFFLRCFIDDVQMGYSYQVGPTMGTPIDLHHLPWLVYVYVYGPDGFSCEHVVGHNTNVMGYPFLKGTRAVSSPSFLSLSFLFLHPTTLVLTPFFQNSTHSIGAWGAGLACKELLAEDDQVFQADLWFWRVCEPGWWWWWWWWWWLFRDYS